MMNSRATWDQARGVPCSGAGDTEVLVRVKAFSLNHLDVWVMSGSYPGRFRCHMSSAPMLRVSSSRPVRKSHFIPGDEVIVFPGLSCGLCEKCRDGRDNECSSFSFGSLNNGVSAESRNRRRRTFLRSRKACPSKKRPASASPIRPPGIRLVLRGGIRQGETVLVHAAGSGSGRALIQVARLYHAKIIATVGDDWKTERPGAWGPSSDQLPEAGFFRGREADNTGPLADIASTIGGRQFNKRSPA